MNFTSILFVTLMLTTSNVFASKLPTHYQMKDISGVGTVDNINVHDKAIVVGDRRYKLSNDVVVHSLSQEIDSLDKVKLGVEISYKTNSVLGLGDIIEIWLLPDGYIEASVRKNR